MLPVLSTWNLPPEKLTLAEDQIDLWRIFLDPPTDHPSSLESLLAADERQRARRLLDPKKARRFVVARGALRCILARYLAIDPATVRFHYGANSKPRLIQSQGDALAFNLSHSGCWALLALGRDCELGVDLEEIDPLLRFEPIAAQFFTPEENGDLNRAPLSRRRRAFYRLWTRKEAWLKGLGWGFSQPASRMVMGDSLWRLKNFPLSRHYLGALAVDRKKSFIRCWQSDPESSPCDNPQKES